MDHWTDQWERKNSRASARQNTKKGKPGVKRKENPRPGCRNCTKDFFYVFFSFFLRSFIGGVAYVTVFNSPATWAATFQALRGYKCMLVIFVFP